MTRYDRFMAERDGLLVSMWVGDGLNADQRRAFRRLRLRLKRWRRQQRDRVMRQRRAKLEHLGSAWVRWKPHPKDVIEPAWRRA